MISTNIKQENDSGEFYMEFAGLSTDSKPTGVHMATGSIFLEVDTGDVYLFDKSGVTWIKYGE